MQRWNPSSTRAGDTTRKEDDITRKVEEKTKLLKNIRESLSADLSDAEIDIHPVIIAQWHYREALKWVLGLDKDFQD